MTLPTALVIGPMKAGTTWMHDYLEARGDVCLPLEVKETFYFDRYHDRGLDWYRHHFRHWDAARHRIAVEVAPSLFHSPDAPSRVRNDLGEVPLIVARRDPVARSWSHYMHLRRYGYTRKPLEEAVTEFPQILTASRYEERLEVWREALPEARIVELDLDVLKTDPDAYVRQLCDALAIPVTPVPEALAGESNKGAVPPSYLAAKFGRSLSYKLRSLGLYNVVNAAKAVGLKPLFFGRGSVRASAKPTEAERALLAERLGLGG
ncbi:sulfotransferase family protein [Pelagibacterium limicola]|uniref:sulfotransferase family protein n=1 Tax=Pelagibacterium limicola TaxID=2791022 RepID=UPI0018B013A2|nr:sulfotransferase [Pelagibacterium limicola]